MKNKVIMVLSDGLRKDTALEQMGFLYHLVEVKRASLYTVIGELPAVSRPMYETIHTGTPVSTHGVYSNQIVRRSKMPNLFQAARDHGKKTAAAAFCWYSELYNKAPYDIIEDRETDDESALIQHGRFYAYDEFPDIELFALGAMLMRRFDPDYLLIHPMGVDDMGHHFGSESPEYGRAAAKQDAILANQVFDWLGRGYNVLVTADHGMNQNKSHNMASQKDRELPLYLILAEEPGRGDTGEVISQLQIAPTICRLLDVPIPETMKKPPIL